MRAVIHIRSFSCLLTLVAIAACGGSSEPPMPDAWIGRDTILLVGQTMDARSPVQTSAGGVPAADVTVSLNGGNPSAFTVRASQIQAVAPGVSGVGVIDPRSQSSAVYRIGSVFDLRVRWQFTSRCAGKGNLSYPTDSLITHFLANSPARFEPDSPDWRGSGGPPGETALVSGTQTDSAYVRRWSSDGTHPLSIVDTAVTTRAVASRVIADTSRILGYAEVSDASGSLSRSGVLTMTSTAPIDAHADASEFCGYSPNQGMTMELRASP